VNPAAIAFFAAAGLAPLVVRDAFLLDGLVLILMWGAAAAAWNIAGGYAGQVSLGHSAFFGLGAYAGAVSQAHGVPPYLASPLAALLTGLFAGALGLTILRLRGHYFAIASLVVGEVLREIANTSTGLTGGGMGLNLPILRLSVLAQARLFYFAMFALAGLTLVTAAVVSRNRLGFGLRSIQQNEDAANIVGVNTTLYKTAGFVLSAVFVGAAGALYAAWVNYIEPSDVFDVLYSVKPIVMVLLGGAGTLGGPVLGAIVFLLLEELVWRNFLTIHAGLLGLIIVALIFFLPGGLLALDLRSRLARAR
jgi:branched-chain amino acid transport system permease protein